MRELICRVCGMKINANNYKFNEHSFIEHNTEENILYCPFCGVSEEFLTEDDSIYIVGKFDEQTRRILDSAMKLEVFNSEFYLEASKMAALEETAQIFRDLSSIELFHARVHMRLGGFKELPKLHKPDYSKHDSDEKLMLEASKREKHAVHFYEKYMPVIEDRMQRRVLEALAQVERQHIELMEK